MFEQTFVSSGKSNKSWSILAAFGVQMAIIGILLLIPLLYYQALPTVQLTSFTVAPPPPPPPPPPPAAPKSPPKVVKTPPRQFDIGRLMAPKAIPKQVAQIRERELAPPSVNMSGSGVVGGVPGGQVGGVVGGVIGAVPAVAPPPPPPPKQETPQRIRVGGNVEAANLIHKVVPPYPTLAKQARIQGTVRLAAIIGKDGHVQNLHAVSGHPLLIQGALDAVKQWVYKPVMLNGQPVEVATEIDVTYTLQ